VARHERQCRVRQLAVDDVEVGAADAARVDLEEHLVRARPRLRQLGLAKWLSRRIEDHGPHGADSRSVSARGKVRPGRYVLDS